MKKTGNDRSASSPAIDDWTVEEIDRWMCGEIWTSKDQMELLIAIAGSGHRFAGTPGERQAQEHIADKFREWGITTEFQPVAIRSWKRGSSSVTLKLNGDDIRLPSRAHALSASTEGETKTMEVIDMASATPADFDRLGDEISGKAVLVSCTRYESVGRTHIESKYVEAIKHGARAYLYSNTSGPVAVTAQAAWPGEHKPIPALSISRESTELIRRALMTGKAEISISVDCRSFPAQSRNLIGNLPGRRETGGIVLGAHLDTHDIAPGAVDNGSGVAVVCELARLFSRFKGRFLRPLTFVLFTGEELDLQGSRAFCRERLTERNRISLFFNFDVSAAGGFPILYTMTQKDAPEYWLRMGYELGYDFPIRQSRSRKSDHFPFYLSGIPCLWLNTYKQGARNQSGFSHSIFDTIDKITSAELNEATMVAARILLRLVNEERDILEPHVAEPEDSGSYSDS